jgi:GNAT superfamily N-acetyltransferase
MLEIRWARLEDARSLGIVHSESYRNTYKGIIPDEFLNQFTPVVREKCFYSALIQGVERIGIMLVDNKAVGCLILRVCSDKDLQKCSGEISAIYLIQNYRFIGLGKQLLNWCLEKLIELGYTTAILWVLKENKNALSFYEKQGFWHDGMERKIFRGIELSQIRYQKALI